MKFAFTSTILAAACFAGAQSLSTGFEGPSYGLGNTLTGTNGWDSISGANVGVIVNDPVKEGTQAVKLVRSGSDAATYGAYLTHSGWITDPAHPIVTIEWDMNLLDGLVKSEMWGMSAMWGTSNERFTLGVNASNKLTVRNAWIGTVQTNIAVARGVWNHYRMDLNYETDWAGVYLNNNYVGEWKMLPGLNELSNTALFNRGFDANDGAIYDGLSIRGGISVEQPVPEPASMAALGLGAMALIRRRRAAKR
ncbi:MAG: hypothetical protein BGO01_15115 [Armatimonadetes bacterium 55-13]|nr:PEP-CTERM sorting domain-containing protein [Armatimonadota bacterium]OJU65198.1 MAG: hypothetical protein BGO01_15115 [Armatimonadetes bacterium 55-13]